MQSIQIDLKHKIYLSELNQINRVGVFRRACELPSGGCHVAAGRCDPASASVGSIRITPLDVSPKTSPPTYTQPSYSHTTCSTFPSTRDN
jgi:hypothetical protein